MERDYRFEVYTEYSGYGDKVFVVKYFDLDNVIGVGDTIEEAIQEAKENLEVYLDYCKENNISIPEPTSHDESNYSGKITVRMSKTLHKLVDDRAKKEGISINLLLNEAISKYVYNLNAIDEFENRSISYTSKQVQNTLKEIYKCYELNEQLKNNKQVYEPYNERGEV